MHCSLQAFQHSALGVRVIVHAILPPSLAAHTRFILSNAAFAALACLKCPVPYAFKVAAYGTGCSSSFPAQGQQCAQVSNGSHMVFPCPDSSAAD